MSTLNPFVENNKARINVFLNNLCEVGDFYETLEVRFTTSLRRSAYSARVWIVGPIHGPFQKGPADQYHPERDV
jgi:hypothetical protein